MSTFETECMNCGALFEITTDAEQPELDAGGFSESGFSWQAYDGDEGHCKECGAAHMVSADGEGADIVWNDGFFDKGQHKTAAVCDVMEEFHGQPCAWDCPQEESNGEPSSV